MTWDESKSMKIEFAIPKGYRKLEVGEKVLPDDMVAIPGAGMRWYPTSEVPRIGGWTVTEKGATLIRKEDVK